ncbi:Gcd10p-domain-containing protein [Multifurca ochricompacta]|uniref:tRNA (adenine(58)-N(1))-methyltransferase non-catalytic subunit TRM6 n=1 Tax=Multifurca ochricompacta TaxID=376703 RepID=A0AAD4MDB4_9AGAM|nr:Gcd10p-domain-containing protein [Multifurca ochricompacta]
MLLEDGIIHVGNTVLLKLPTGDTKSYRLEPNSTINLGKFGSFLADTLINHPYGLTYEVINKTINVIPPPAVEELEDTDATNELINDGQFVQPLTAAEIEALKQSGVHASEIIKKQIEMHANYSRKTEYSKDKYKKRKVAKYSKSFTTVQPTLFNVCEYWFTKDQTRILGIRIDTLSQMMNFGSVRPGGRYITVDDASGILVSAVLERLGGTGRLITICDVDSPPAYPVMTQMNFPSDLTASVLASLNWATADESYIPIVLSTEPASGSYGSEKHKTRLSKRKTASDALFGVREELFAGEFEGLFVASVYDPLSIIERLFPYLGGSASVVVYSPHLQVVSDLQATLRHDPQYLAPSVSESWLRRYQVLPGRTHPLMTTSGGGGYLLHTIKIYNDPSAEPVAAHRRSKTTSR